ncbi:MAG: ABC transporter permease [Bradymonadales bacterium]|nr:ABC transporter permease [Bradymonadales bacterium]
MIARLAVRNLFRNRWRSALTAGGVAVATALLTWSICLFDGMMAEMVRGATAVQMGQVQVHDKDYIESPTLFHHFPQDEALFDRIGALPEVSALSPRAYAYGLAGHERKSQVVQLIGVDPGRESSTTVITRGLIAGRWLSQTPPALPAPREVVVGTTFADQLGLQVGDELVLFLQATDGSLGNDLLEVVGIVRTGNLMVDRQAFYLHLADLQYDAVLEGRIHELAIRVQDVARAPQVAQQVANILESHRQAAGPGRGRTIIEQPELTDVAHSPFEPPQADGAIPGDPSGIYPPLGRVEADQPGVRAIEQPVPFGGEERGPAESAEPNGDLVARPWQAIVPELAMYVEMTDVGIWVTIFLVYLMVALGILNAQRMSALERRREFGVLLAIGLTPRQLGHIVVAETVVLTLAGAILGAALGLALSAYYAHAGFDMGMFSEQASYSFMGVSFSDRIYFVLSAGSVLLPLVSVTVVAILCGIWPAIKSARLNATQAIAGRS